MISNITKQFAFFIGVGGIVVDKFSRSCFLTIPTEVARTYISYIGFGYINKSIIY